MSNNQLIKSSALKDIVQRDEVKSRLKEIMGQRAPQFAAALVQIVQQSKQLQKCEPNSIIGAALTAAALDLSIDPNLGQAHIVPYGEKAQFQIGYAGFAQLAQRSGQYKNLGWKVIHKGELISYDELSGELEVNSDHPDDEVVGYAAKFKLVNGFERAEYWTALQIENHAYRYSKAYRYAKGDKKEEANCLWVTSRDRMALKTVLKSLLKIWGPKSIQMQQALKVDDAAIVDVDAGDVTYIDNPSEAEPSKPEFSRPAKEPPVKESEPEERPAAVQPDTGQEKKDDAGMISDIRAFIKKALLKEPDVIAFIIGIGAVEGNPKTLEDVAKESPETIDLLHRQHAEIFERIKQL